MKKILNKCPVCGSCELEYRQTAVRISKIKNGKKEKIGKYILAETAILCSDCSFEKII